ncbi:rRNA-processing protein [Martiniozyma asiatica (nom. inval.)]|nr:rRNA-processing protein [Martiniozyma asiatica]
MKIKTISRSADAYVPVRNTQESALPRNLNPELHPFERAREYTRALNATKLSRVFAQPFIGQLGDGHRDGVYSVAKNFKSVNKLASGSGDGVIKYWDLTSREETGSFKAHYGLVSGLVVTPQHKLLSCGSDKTIKLWDINNDTGYGQDYNLNQNETSTQGLSKTFLSDFSLTSLDHHHSDDIFITGGAQLNLWDINRNRPISDLSWGADNVTTVRFNKTETSIFASAGSDNSLILYDIRTNSPTQKIKTSMRNNSICWNPMEAFVFATANEDQNAYLWDMRKMESAINVFKDHVSAVMDVDFAPTGKEIVTGSYDRTIRLFSVDKGHSRDVYHTKRMQRVFLTKFSTDSKYILSGSDDGNVRIWRTVANERSAPKSSRMRQKEEYDRKLMERYANMPEIRRISRHRHLPAEIKRSKDVKGIEIASIQRKESNRRRNQKTERERVPERRKIVVGKVHKA